MRADAMVSLWSADDGRPPGRALCQVSSESFVAPGFGRSLLRTYASSGSGRVWRSARAGIARPARGWIWLSRPLWWLALGALLVTTACSGHHETAEHVPADTGDGWQVATPQSVGIDAKLAANIDATVRADFPYVRAVVVARDGRLVVENYYRGGSASYHVNVHSVTKSVISMLVGVGLVERKINSLHQTVGQLLPASARPMSHRTAAITLEQLLTMTSGLPPDPANASYPQFASTRDWVGGILASGPVQPPGQGFQYSSAGSHLLSAILQRATGQSTASYAHAKLFTPLGIDSSADTQLTFGAVPDTEIPASKFAWLEDPQGITCGWSGLWLTARDMAKLGQLYLDHGRWKGRQVVPADWVRASTQPATRTSVTLGNLSFRYGYQWWIAPDSAHPFFAAAGYGGQLIAVVPDLGIVLAIAADGPPVEDAAKAEGVYQIIERIVIPAVGHR
jgi:CubicO group peptidase (beta-lactamase class C family)